MLIEVTVDLQSWGRTTGCNTLNCIECVVAVSCCFAALNAQALLQVRNQRIAIAQVTRNTGADINDLFTLRLLIIHGIESSNTFYIINRQVNRLSDRLQSFAGNIALLL